MHAPPQCSGFQYKFELVEEADENDTCDRRRRSRALSRPHRVISNQDAELVVDDISLPFLRGSIIGADCFFFLSLFIFPFGDSDYEKELVRSAFVVTHNPNSDSSCGCGSSFVAKI